MVRTLFEGGCYLRAGSIFFAIVMGGLVAHATTTHTLRIRMEVQNRHRVGGLARPPWIAAMIMKDDKVVSLAMFPARA